jgi:spermidine/putrescine transport system permease protein
VIFGLTYNFIPFMTLPLYTTLERLDTRYLEAGSDLYANPFTVFRKITIPLSMPGIVAGTLLTFIPAAGDYVNASRDFLAGQTPR